MNDFTYLYGTDYSVSVDLGLSTLFFLFALGVVALLPVGRTLKRAMLAALAVRFVAAILLHLFAPYGLFADDNWAYAWYGKRLAEYWEGHTAYPTIFTGRDEGLLYYIAHALVFRWVAYAPLLMSTFSCAGGVAAVGLTHRVTRQVAGEGAADRAAWLVALFPSLVLWSSMNLRDIWVILANLLLTLSILEFRAGRPVAAGVAAVVGAYVVRALRPYLLPLVVAGTGLGGAMTLSRSRAYFWSLVVAVVLAAAGVVAYLLNGGDTLAAILNDLSTQRKNLAEGGGAFYKDTRFETLGDVVRFAPIGFAYFMFGPFPWTVSGVRQAMTLPETLLWYALLTRVWVGARSLLRSSPHALGMILAQLAVLVVPYSLVSGNVGTGYRHRAQSLPYVFMLAAVGLVPTRGRLGRASPAFTLATEPPAPDPPFERPASEPAWPGWDDASPHPVGMGPARAPGVGAFAAAAPEHRGTVPSAPTPLRRYSPGQAPLHRPALFQPSHEPAPVEVLAGWGPPPRAALVVGRSTVEPPGIPRAGASRSIQVYDAPLASDPVPAAGLVRAGVLAVRARGRGPGVVLHVGVVNPPREQPPTFIPRPLLVPMPAGRGDEALVVVARPAPSDGRAVDVRTLHETFGPAAPDLPAAPAVERRTAAAPGNGGGESTVILAEGRSPLPKPAAIPLTAGAERLGVALLAAPGAPEEPDGPDGCARVVCTIPGPSDAGGARAVVAGQGVVGRERAPDECPAGCDRHEQIAAAQADGRRDRRPALDPWAVVIGVCGCPERFVSAPCDAWDGGTAAGLNGSSGGSLVS